ncbi:MAG: alpha/beta hydrolase [Aureliella sp.]
MNLRIESIYVLLGLLIGCTAPPSDPIPKHQSFEIKSSILGETRVLCIWTPPGYEDSGESYPVLYMPDGGIREDFPHIANTLAGLVAAGTVPPMILVGIENTERRRDLTGPSKVEADGEIAPTSDGSSKFRAFIADELFPEVGRRYRTTEQRSIIGESAAGLFVVETLFLQPELFSVYIAMDPAIYWNDSYLVRSAAKHLRKLPEDEICFWFAGSSVVDIQPHTRELAKILESEAPERLDWIYSDEPGEEHSTIFRATKKKAMTWALGR